MKKVKVRKTLEYDPTCGGRLGRYEGFCRIVLGLEDPGILPGQNKLKKKTGLVLCSTKGRAKESVAGGKSTSLLDEVRFDLSKMVTSEEYEQYGSNLVRTRFVEAFEKDELKEKRKEIKARVEGVLKLLKSVPEEKILLVSHSFFMKVLEVYLLHRDLFEKPQLLKECFNTDKKTYNFGEGFDFEI